MFITVYNGVGCWLCAVVFETVGVPNHLFKIEWVISAGKPFFDDKPLLGNVVFILAPNQSFDAVLLFSFPFQQSVIPHWSTMFATHLASWCSVWSV